MTDLAVLDRPATSGSLAARLRRATLTRSMWLVLAAVALVAAMVASVAWGSRDVSWADIVGALGGAQETLGEAAVTKRIPRTLLAAVVGAALGLAGTVMQGVTRNPLADPGILGVNMGASLSVAIAVAYFGLSSSTGYVWAGITGAGIAAVFVYAVASLGRGGATPLKLALAGAATSAALVSLVGAVVLGRNDIGETFQDWQVGGVGGATYDKIGTIAPFVVAGLVICVLSARGLNSLALGDELAAGLGQNVMRTRLIAALGAVILCGASTAVTGPIAFLGLIVPHMCRLLVGPDHRWLLPFSALLGATLLTTGDVVGRVIARPQEIEVGIITSLIGAPVFILIVRRQKMRAL